MNVLVCGSYVNYYVWSSYILTQYSPHQRFCNYGHEEMRGDYGVIYVAILHLVIYLFYIKIFILY